MSDDGDRPEMPPMFVDEDVDEPGWPHLGPGYKYETWMAEEQAETERLQRLAEKGRLSQQSPYSQRVPAAGFPGVIRPSKREAFINQAVSELLLYGDSDAIWAKLLVKAQHELFSPHGAIEMEMYRAEVRAAFDLAQEERDHHRLRQAILAAQKKEGLA